MAYFEKQGESAGGQVQSITGQQSKANIYDLIGDDNVLLSLGNRTPGQSGIGKKPPKTAISQKQADENKRQQLSKILEEQQKKFKEKEKKLQSANQKNAVHTSAGAVLQGN